MDEADEAACLHSMTYRAPMVEVWIRLQPGMMPIIQKLEKVAIVEDFDPDEYSSLVNYVGSFKYLGSTSSCRPSNRGGGGKVVNLDEEDAASIQQSLSHAMSLLSAGKATD